MLTSWVKLDEEDFIKEDLWLKILKRTYQLPNGQLDDFYVKQEGPATCILALTAEQKVVLVKQYRPGPDEILLELPGGCINEEELPETAARREFLEETGYSGDFQFIGTSLDCAYSTMIRYNFVATQCYKVRDKQLDDTEFVKVVEMPLEDFRNHLRSGKLTDVETGYLGLDFLGLL
ncbi:MAG: NUDIX hydrolase [Candidatus Hodarchaeota archaeon]